MFKRKHSIQVLLVFLFGFLVGSVVYRGYFRQEFTPQNSSLFEKIQQIDSVLQDKYLFSDKLDYKKMNDQALNAYVEQPKDPYISYFSAKVSSWFLNFLKGKQEFAGIGAVVTKKDEYILIEEVLKKSPSAKAGLLPLDRVLEINDESVKDMDIDTAVSKMRGSEGTQVILWIYREQWKETQDGKLQTFEISITREKIDLPSVYVDILTGTNNKKILYIQLILIGEETDALLKQELAQIDPETIDGIIVDVRGNGGGYMPVAVDIVSHFVPKNKLVASAKYLAYPEENYYSKYIPFVTGKNIVVLTDELTASAGEIIALGLQELADATLLGTKTFWKGSIQTMYEFPDQSSLKYTIGKRYTPSGRNIDHEGVIPDIQLEFDRENYITNAEDNQIQKALEVL